jgi:ADP-ribose pyrophosphatase YjhB (NUDIX family)
MEERSSPPIDPTSLAAWADELRAMAAIGLLYSLDHFDQERYARLQTLAAEMMSAATGHPADAVEAALTKDVGYVTVKVGVAAAIFDPAGRILLLRRRDNGLWAMPGGWADVGTDTPAGMTAREVREETRLEVRVDRLLGLYDSRFRRFRHPHHLYHIVFHCTPIGGSPEVTEESLAIDYFTESDLPPLVFSHVDAVHDAFRQWADPTLPPVFD